MDKTNNRLSANAWGNKRLCAAAALLALIAVFFSCCGKKLSARLVHCDRCGKECRVLADSKMTEDWIVY